MTDIPQEAIKAAARAICKSLHGNGYDLLSPDDKEEGWKVWIDEATAALTAAMPVIAGWRSIDSAKKNGSPVLLLLKDPIPARSDDEHLHILDGAQFVGRHPGLTRSGFDSGWNFSAPVGYGGIPDYWIEGWMPLPPPPGAGGTTA